MEILWAEEGEVKDADAVGINLTLGMGWDMGSAHIWECMSVSFQSS